jgi:hypothetical protein
MHKKQKYFDLSLPNSDIHNHLHQFTTATKPQSVLQTTPSNANDQESRSMKLLYFLLLDGETQQYFRFYHQPGLENFGDYPSKHHSADKHQHIRPYFVLMDNPHGQLSHSATKSYEAKHSSRVI